VTIGGKTLFNTRTGAKLIPISKKLQISAVPRSIPKASGHAWRVIVPSCAVVEGQVPSAYMASKICDKGGISVSRRGSRDVEACRCERMHGEEKRKEVVRTPNAVLSVEKLVPTTLSKPVPKK
jgi:hypothetical protein